MLLRNELLEAAVSAAKSRGHGSVEPRHVLFAIARRFRANPEAGALFNRAREALEPTGSAHGVPVTTAEATALLESITDERTALAALVSTLGGLAPDGSASGGAQVQAARQDQPKTAAASQEPGKKPETTADVLADLDALIGLAAVKEQVRNVVSVVQANAARVKAGLAPVNPSLHLVFTGPPGTGKTTVARIIARLYASTGALPGAGFTEATRADLVAGYVGQTAIKTMDVIRSTKPGVLFIDEAYALTPSSEVDFGAEAIATLVKAMEDYRDELAVIVAGYGEEMTDFVASNPGLRSRFKTYIDFPDYTPAELYRIFELFAQEVAIALADGVREKAEEVLAEASRRGDFGNARFARSLFEQAYARMAARAAADGRVSVSELRAIVPDDIVLDDDALRRERRRIGFGGGGGGA
ncbi:MAG TPA: AAA family ATPase [Gemmatimonadales bacterium]|nr:AAA family ATPase [Gemmatimonadales bacterium]